MVHTFNIRIFWSGPSAKIQLCTMIHLTNYKNNTGTYSGIAKPGPTRTYAHPMWVQDWAIRAIMQDYDTYVQSHAFTDVTDCLSKNQPSLHLSVFWEIATNLKYSIWENQSHLGISQWLCLHSRVIPSYLAVNFHATSLENISKWLTFVTFMMFFKECTNLGQHRCEGAVSTNGGVGWGG